MVQSATADFKTALAKESRKPGIEIHVEGWPVFTVGRGWTVAAAPFPRTPVFGDPLGFTFGDTNPDTGLPLVFGDSVNDISPGVLHNVLSISSWQCGVTPQMRVPNVPVVEIVLSHSDGKLATLPDPMGFACTIKYNLTSNAFDQITLFSGKVKSFGEDAVGVTYKLKLEDELALLNKSIFGETMSTELTQDMGTGDDHMHVASTEGFPDVGYLFIGEETFHYSAKSVGLFSSLSRPYGTAITHTTKDKVSALYLYNANLRTHILRILTSTGAGTNGAYDIYPACFGAGYPANKIDISAIESFVPPDGNTGAQLFDFIFWKKTKCAEVLSPMLAALNAFLVRKNNGVLTIVPDNTPASEKTFTNPYVIDLIQKDRGDQINRIEWESKVQPLDSWSIQTKTTEDSPMVARDGEYKQVWHLPVLGSWTVTGGGKPYQVPPDIPTDPPSYDDRLFHIQTAAAYAIGRYKNPPKLYKVNTFFSNTLIELGDGSTIGTDIARIIGRKVDLMKMQIELQAIKNV